MVVHLSLDLVMAFSLAAVWLWYSCAAARGMRSIPDITRPEWCPTDDVELPRVSVVVPARNEESMIAAAVGSLLALDYPDFEVIAVNDRSTDETGKILDHLSAKTGKRLRVIHVNELPAGWLGKTHAMHVAAEHSKGDWILFTDADVIHRADSLARSILYARNVRADHLVVFPTVIMESWGERMMIALFQSLFIFAHRPWKVADPNASDHIGMGAFNLIRADAYRSIGGYKRLKLAVIDDLRLGAAVKRAGLTQHVVFGPDLVRVRWAHGLLGVVRNTQKNFFAEFGYNPLLVAAAVIAVLFLQLGPWIGVVSGHGLARVGYAVALTCAFSVYAGGSNRTVISHWYFLLHPLATLLLIYAIVRSTVVTLFRGGVVWRGTKYPLKELRRAVGD